MLNACNYKSCGHGAYPQLIPRGKEVSCSICGERFHEDCFKKHTVESHCGKARPKKCIPPPKPFGLVHRYALLIYAIFLITASF